MAAEQRQMNEGSVDKDKEPDAVSLLSCMLWDITSRSMVTAQQNNPTAPQDLLAIDASSLLFHSIVGIWIVVICKCRECKINYKPQWFLSLTGHKLMGTDTQWNNYELTDAVKQSFLLWYPHLLLLLLLCFLHMIPNDKTSSNIID